MIAAGGDDFSRGEQTSQSQFAHMVTHSNLPSCASILLAVRMDPVFLGNRVVPSAVDPFDRQHISGIKSQSSVSHDGILFDGSCWTRQLASDIA